ncbi:MAG: radical SAM peptide maturase [Tannerella sp.]|jgi:uncharacterized protein|nr:radical SAM peptide maturase [Tannerella sp.]
MKDLIYAKSGHGYLYSESKNSFLFIPPGFISDTNDSESDTDYYKRKQAFWEEKGVFTPEKRNLDTAYDTAYIESNLANLRQLLIEVTDDCNLSCTYCGYGELYGNYDKRKGKNQTFENVKALIDYLAGLWLSDKNISFDTIIYIGFYGGEPLLNFPLIKQTIDYLETIPIEGLKFEYNMTTNGVLLSRYMDYLAEKEFHLLISLDGTRENNSYRVTKSGKESFDTIISNVQKLQETYPDYFEAFVGFNSVLHNRNSVASSYEFIKQLFNKKTSIGELSYSGIVEEQREAFATMFTEKSASMKQAMNCEAVVEDLFGIDPQTMQLSNFFEAYTDHTYRSLPDLFFKKDTITYLPTSTCPPFYKKIFLTVNGKILPCEKIGQRTPLGSVTNGVVELHSEEIKKIYMKLYGDIIRQCEKCYAWKNCGCCIYLFNANKEGKIVCDRFFGKKEIIAYFADALSTLEEKPEYYEKISKELTID